MSSTRLAILALNTLALAGTSYTPLKALTILLSASTLGAFATFEMLISSDLVVESVSSTFENLANGFLSFRLVVVVVLAGIFIIVVLDALTLRATGGFVSEAFTVQLEALGVLAFASKTLRYSIFFHSSEEFSLSDSLINDRFCELIQLFFFLLDLLLLVVLGYLALSRLASSIL